MHNLYLKCKGTGALDVHVPLLFIYPPLVLLGVAFACVRESESYD
jgi:hypothetical protein